MIIIRPSWIFVGWLIGVFATLGTCALDLNAIRNSPEQEPRFMSGFTGHYLSFWIPTTMNARSRKDQFDSCYDRNGQLLYTIIPLKMDDIDKATSR